MHDAQNRLQQISSSAPLQTISPHPDQLNRIWQGSYSAMLKKVERYEKKLKTTRRHIKAKTPHEEIPLDGFPSSSPQSSSPISTRKKGRRSEEQWIIAADYFDAVEDESLEDAPNPELIKETLVLAFEAIPATAKYFGGHPAIHGTNAGTSQGSEAGGKKRRLETSSSGGGEGSRKSSRIARLGTTATGNVSGNAQRESDGVKGVDARRKKATARQPAAGPSSSS